MSTTDEFGCAPCAVTPPAADQGPTDFYFIKGGPCIPKCLPMCDPCGKTARTSHLPYPHRVAGEYDRGHFTLGAPLNPRGIEAQRNAFACKAAKAGDFISLLLIPPTHLLEDVFLEVSTEQTTFVPVAATYKNNMAGLVFDVEVRKYGIDGSFKGVLAVPGSVMGVDAAKCGAYREPVEANKNGYFVPDCEWLEVGLKIVALPSTAGVTMDKISGAFGLVAHVRDYQYPFHL